jgi:hypothetical protein
MEVWRRNFISGVVGEYVVVQLLRGEMYRSTGKTD